MIDMSAYVLDVGRGSTQFQTIWNMGKEEFMNVKNVNLIKYKVKCTECGYSELFGAEERSYYAAQRHERANRHIVNRYMCIEI